jgi:hypothetical protein
MITIPVSVGELIDKLSILHVKKNKVLNEQKLKEIQKEFFVLKKISDDLLGDKDLFNLYDDLIQVNNQLWDIEDKIRIYERNENFGSEFIELARSVYYTNDKRFELKNRINQMTNSEIKEQKSYQDYKIKENQENIKKTYIFESPDGGQTIYRREMGQSHDTRELIQK